MRAPPTFEEIRDEIQAEDYEERLRDELIAYATDCVECGLTFGEIATILRKHGHDLNARDVRAMCVEQWIEDAAAGLLN